jgi:hypothetical protein
VLGERSGSRLSVTAIGGERALESSPLLTLSISLKAISLKGDAARTSVLGS